MRYTERFRVAPGTKVKLTKIDTRFTTHHESHKEAADGDREGPEEAPRATGAALRRRAGRF